MQKKNVNYKPVMDQPATYQIEVQGRLSERWAAMFDNMTITAKSEENGLPITILKGPVVDQAALHGLLNRIGDLGLPLISVKRMGTA